MMKWIGVVLLLALFVVAVPSVKQASAAYDCVNTHRLSVDVLTTDNERIGFVGAQITVLNDPQDGLGSRVYTDNGNNDDSVVIGRVQEDRACAAIEGSQYTIELSFDESKAKCQVVEQENAVTSLPGDTTVTFHVHDCLQAVATPTPTATVTSTPTATSTVVPTATVAPTQTPVVIFVPVEPVVPTVAVVAPPQVIVITATPASTSPVHVSPPNTGSGGLVPRKNTVSNEWGDGDDSGGCCYQDFGPIPCSNEESW